MVLGKKESKRKVSQKKKKVLLGLSHHQYGLLPPENMVYTRVKISPSGEICSISAKPQGAWEGGTQDWRTGQCPQGGRDSQRVCSSHR